MTATDIEVAFQSGQLPQRLYRRQWAVDAMVVASALVCKGVCRGPQPGVVALVLAIERIVKKRPTPADSGFFGKGFTAYPLTTSFKAPKLRFVPEIRLFSCGLPLILSTVFVLHASPDSHLTFSPATRPRDKKPSSRLGSIQSAVTQKGLAGQEGRRERGKSEATPIMGSITGSLSDKNRAEMFTSVTNSNGESRPLRRRTACQWPPQPIPCFVVISLQERSQTVPVVQSSEVCRVDRGAG